MDYSLISTFFSNLRLASRGVTFSRTWGKNFVMAVNLQPHNYKPLKGAYDLQPLRSPQCETL